MADRVEHEGRLRRHSSRRPLAAVEINNPPALIDPGPSVETSIALLKSRRRLHSSLPQCRENQSMLALRFGPWVTFKVPSGIDCVAERLPDRTDTPPRHAVVAADVAT
jgi:hypothetical protein